MCESITLADIDQLLYDLRKDSGKFSSVYGEPGWELQYAAQKSCLEDQRFVVHFRESLVQIITMTQYQRGTPEGEKRT